MIVHLVGVAWCNVVHLCWTTPMNKANRPAKADPVTVRASVTFPSDLYATLESIAKDKKVSVAWIVRDAAEKYVNDQWPLFDNREKGE